MIGAGVVGLSCGIRLLESGYVTRIVSRDVSPDTVSDIAAAWWYPFLAEPVEKTTRWSIETYHELLRLKHEFQLGFITMRKGLNTLLSQVHHQNGVMAYHTLESSTSMRLLKATNLVGR